MKSKTVAIFLAFYLIAFMLLSLIDNRLAFAWLFWRLAHSCRAEYESDQRGTKHVPQDATPRE